VEELEEVSEEGGEGGERQERGLSMISTETEKRGAEFKLKVENYLVQNRNSIPANERGRLEEENKDGMLMDELNNIHQNEKFNQESELFILMFNKKPENAIADYVTKGFIHEDSPDAIAEYIIKMEGIDKTVLGEYFGRNDKKVLDVLHSYCKLMKFTGQEFDRAMRTLLSKFRLPGEAQQIERVIWEFALAFYEANIDSYDNADELFPLAYAIIMLSTDAHNPKQERKMTCDEFVKNTRRPCPSISEDYLSHIY
jgi:Sec7-like guanine-nucleotide exchange factor